MAEIFFHSSLVRFTENQSKAELFIDNLAELIPSLSHRFPRLTDNIIHETGELIPYVNCYLNGSNINSLSPDTAVAQDAKIEFVTALVGG